MNNLRVKKILETSPIYYIYGIKEETKSGVDVFVTESSIGNFKNKLLGDIIKYDLNLEAIYKDYHKIIREIFDGKKIVDKTVNFEIVDEDKIIFWFNKEYLNRTLTLEEKLKRQNKFIETFFNSICDCVFLKNMEGRYIYCNNIFANKFGLKKEHILGKNDKEIFSHLSTDVEKFRETDFDVITSKESRVYYSNWGFKKDQFLFQETLKLPLLNEYNEVEGVIGIIRDFSYQKAIENRLNAGEKLAFKVFDNSTDIVVIKDGQKTIYVNDAIEKIYGVNKKEIYRDENFIFKLEMIHAEDRYLLDNIENMDELSEKVRIIRKDNEEKTVLFKYNTVVIDENNKLNMIVIRDITESLAEEYKLEKLKGEIFANLSHEFKTPVNLIYSVLQILEFKFKNSDSKLTKEYLDYLESGKKNIFRLMKLINNLLDSNKLENNLFNIERKDRDIVSCVENIISEAYKYISEKNISEKNISIIFDTEEEEYIISFDSTQLERIVLNLISNSIKFNEKEVDIKVNLSFDSDYVNISIKDNGIGIPKDKIDSLFSRVKIINNRLTKLNEGCGMGLFITKELVNMHNGKIDVKSELGVGSEFIVKIPNIRVEEEAFDDVSITIFNQNKMVENCKIELSDIYL